MKQLTIYLMLIGSVFGLRADINNDGRVDLLDLAILSEEWLMAEYGPELVTEGAFDDGGAAWSLGDSWSVVAEKGTFFDDVGVPPGNLEQALVLAANTSYLVVFELDNIAGGSDVVTTIGSVSLANHSTDGIKTETIETGATPAQLLRMSILATPSSFNVDDISVREVSVADTIEKAIFDMLRLDSTVSGLVSTRIYPQIIPQNTALPAIIYSQIAGPRQHTLESTDNMVPSRWQFTCVAETYAELRGVSDAIRGVLDSYMGVCGTVEIQCAHFIDENDLTDVLPGTDKLRRYMKAIDFYIWYNE